MWLCTFSLSVSLGAVLLLPISILGNEVLTLYEDSLYVRWINLSLIQGNDYTFYYSLRKISQIIIFI